MARKQVTEDDPPRKRRPLFFALRLTFWVVVAYFAIQGGEYGTSDLLSVRSRIGDAKVAIDSLKRVADSLSLLKRDVMTNPAVQERIAREQFGMVRGDKELVFRVLRPDSATRASDSATRTPAP